MELHPHTLAFLDTFFDYALVLLIIVIFLSGFMHGEARKRD